MDPERAYFQRRLGEFTKEAHSFEAETEMNCRPELSSFYHEMGNHSQSAIGFFQPCSEEDVIFLSMIAEGKLGALRDNPDKLWKLKNISPVLHDVYSSLRSEREETLFNKVTRGLYNIYMSCFDENPQWWEEEREVLPKMNEQYMISGRKKVRDLPQYLGNHDIRSCKKVPYNTANFTGTFFLACSHGFFISSLLMQVRFESRNAKV